MMKMGHAKEICQDCGKLFWGGPHAFLCPDCRKEHQRLGGRRSAEKRGREKEE